MRRGSLRVRLLAAGAASIVLALALAGFGLVLLFERHVERRMAVELEAYLRQLVSSLEQAGDGSLQLAREPADPRFQEPLSGLYWQIALEPDGQLLRSRSLWDGALDRQRIEEQRVDQRENRSVHADAKGKRDDGRGRKRRRPAKRAQRESNVFPEPLHEGSL